MDSSGGTKLITPRGASAGEVFLLCFSKIRFLPGCRDFHDSQATYMLWLSVQFIR